MKDSHLEEILKFTKIQTKHSTKPAEYLDYPTLNIKYLVPKYEKIVNKKL